MTTTGHQVRSNIFSRKDHSVVMLRAGKKRECKQVSQSARHALQLTGHRKNKGN